MRTITQSGTYYHLTDYGGVCEFMDTLTVHITTMSKIRIVPEDLCSGSAVAVRLEGTGPDHRIRWHDSSAADRFPTDTPGTFCATVTHTTGCLRLFCADVFQYPPLPSEVDTTVCPGDAAVFAAPPGRTVLCPDSAAASAFCRFAAPGSYTVRYHRGTCPEQEIAVRVRHMAEGAPPCNCPWHVPNAVTPNRDTLNDTWAPWNECPGSSYCYEIYNRWGQRVHSACNEPWHPQERGRFPL